MVVGNFCNLTLQSFCSHKEWEIKRVHMLKKKKSLEGITIKNLLEGIYRFPYHKRLSLYLY